AEREDAAAWAILVTSRRPHLLPASYDSPCMILRATVFSLLLLYALPLALAARFVAVVPQAANAARGDFLTAAAGIAARPPISGESADIAWLEYLATWQQHFDDPADASVRQRLGLP